MLLPRGSGCHKGRQREGESGERPHKGNDMELDLKGEQDWLIGKASPAGWAERQRRMDGAVWGLLLFI